MGQAPTRVPLESFVMATQWLITEAGEMSKGHPTPRGVAGGCGRRPSVA